MGRFIQLSILGPLGKLWAFCKRTKVALGLTALVLIATECATVPITGRSQLLLISDGELAELSDE